MKSNRIVSIIIESNRELGDSFQAYVSLLCIKTSSYKNIIPLISSTTFIRQPGRYAVSEDECKCHGPGCCTIAGW